MTHTVLKRPGPGEFRVQQHLGGSVEARPAAAAVIAAAHQALQALPLPPLYARIDGVETPDDRGCSSTSRPPPPGRSPTPFAAGFGG